MTPDAPERFGPFVVTLEPAEIEAAAARYGLRAALGGGLTARHHAPLAAFVLTLVFAAILALTGLISRRAGEMTFILAAAAFMIQRLFVHRRMWRAKAGARAEVERALAGGAATATIEPDGVTQTCGQESRRLAFADCVEAEQAGGLIYLWRRAGAPFVLPSRDLADGEAERLIAFARARIRRSQGA